ncbi:adenosylcobinamide-phosphate synthase CbiB [Ensifer soli]|uniref:adenosylcobinamide-phosphate synthase CbiB n=1 Tax=Ciceribacter sp. sgz301302 TaxID=3342379 RepID=UPI0035BB9067
MSAAFGMLAAALVLDRLVGDPDWLWKRFSHPVAIFGRAISGFERVFNRPIFGDRLRRLGGVLTIAVLLGASLLAGWIAAGVLRFFGDAGRLAEIAVVAVFLAQKSLADHVGAVASALRSEGLAGGRRAVSRIVGRDPATLDQAGVSRAAIESLSENFSDGVVAPAFWYLVLGLPGILAYKMLNTADSMIGHRSERYRQFGWASARLDDLANLLPARLSALLLIGAAGSLHGMETARRALAVCLRDHGLHRSPNAGWPETAMAGTLGIQLAGPRVYGGVRVEEPMQNPEGRGDAGAADIEAGIRLFYRACTLLVLALLLPAVLIS